LPAWGCLRKSLLDEGILLLSTWAILFQAQNRTAADVPLAVANNLSVKHLVFDSFLLKAGLMIYWQDGANIIFIHTAAQQARETHTPCGAL